MIAATSDDLRAAIRARRFREDLYHRLAVVTLPLPPLRERGDDIDRLAAHFLARACEDYGLHAKTLSAEASAALRGHAWPGNVRELANVMVKGWRLAAGANEGGAARRRAARRVRARADHPARLPPLTHAGTTGRRPSVTPFPPLRLRAAFRL